MEIDADLSPTDIGWNRITNVVLSPAATGETGSCPTLNCSASAPLMFIIGVPVSSKSEFPVLCIVKAISL